MTEWRENPDQRFPCQPMAGFSTGLEREGRSASRRRLGLMARMVAVAGARIRLKRFAHLHRKAKA